MAATIDFPPSLSLLMKEDSPPYLAHYTRFQVLGAILESQQLWATRHQNLNDVVEVDYAMDVAREVAGDLAHEAQLVGDEVRMRMYAGIVGDILDHEHRGLNFHVLSMSMAEDAPGQWRFYAPPHTGLCLVFAGRPLVERARASGAFAAPCVYDPTQQRQMIRTLLEYHGNATVARKLMEDPTARSANSTGWRYPLWLLSAFIKHPDFSSEEEWRCVWPDPRFGGFPPHSVHPQDVDLDSDGRPARLRPSFEPLPLQHVVLTPRQPYLDLKERVEAEVRKFDMTLDVKASKYGRRPGVSSFPVESPANDSV